MTTPLRSWLQRLFSTKHRGRRGVKARSVQLGVECLEMRAIPSASGLSQSLPLSATMTVPLPPTTPIVVSTPVSPVPITVTDPVPVAPIIVTDPVPVAPIIVTDPVPVAPAVTDPGPAAPIVVTNPVSQTVVPYQDVTFTATATGSPTPTVQWQVSTDGGNTFTDLAGENASSLTPFHVYPPQYGGPNQNGWEYRAVFTNAGGQVTTSAATLTVNVPRWMTTTDSSLVNLYSEYQAYLAGPQTQPFQFPSQDLVGGGGYVTVSVYTPYPNEPQAFADIESALTSAGAQNMLPWQGFVVSASLPISQLPTIGALSDVSWVEATIPPINVAYPGPLPPISPIEVIAYPYPPLILPINIVVNPVAIPIDVGIPIFVAAPLPPLILTNPVSRTITAGQNVTLSAAASGNPKVQWQVSTNGGKTFKNVAGANESTLTLRASPALDGFEFRAVFTNANGQSTTSAAKLVVKVSRGSAR